MIILYLLKNGGSGKKTAKNSCLRLCARTRARRIAQLNPVHVGRPGSAQSGSSMSACPQNSNRDTKEEQQEGMEEEEEKNKKEKKKKGKKKEEKTEAKESWTDFIYNRRSGEFLGRTCSSWGEFCRKTGPTRGSARVCARAHVWFCSLET